MAKDHHTHAPKDVILTHDVIGEVVTEVTGLTAPSPKSVATACGKRRPYARTSSAPMKVTCLECRKDAAEQHAAQATTCETAVKLLSSGETASDVDIDEIAAAVRRHRLLEDLFQAPRSELLKMHGV